MTSQWKYIVAIRKTDGREWPDTRTMKGLLELSEDYAKQENKECGPQWAKANPVVRFATIEIREI